MAWELLLPSPEAFALVNTDDCPPEWLTSASAPIRRPMARATTHGGYLDPAFKYVRHESTDIALTFKRVRKFLKGQANVD